MNAFVLRRPPIVGPQTFLDLAAEKACRRSEGVGAGSAILDIVGISSSKNVQNTDPAGGCKGLGLCGENARGSASFSKERKRVFGRLHQPSKQSTVKYYAAKFSLYIRSQFTAETRTL